MQIVRLALMLSVGASMSALAQQAWQLSAKPTLVLGDAQSNVLFGNGLTAATRLSDGRILVGDRGDFSLRLFAPDGKHVRDFGRKGLGPGEIDYLADLYQCGNRILAAGSRSLVTPFDLQLRVQPVFRFAHRPYVSACNAAGTFVHYGFTGVNYFGAGRYRDTVGVWITGSDSAVRRRLDPIPGAERWGTVSEGGLGRASRPMPLGKQPVIAIGPDRIYVGSADSYEIIVYDTSGKRVGTIRKPGAAIPVTKADIDLAFEREASRLPDTLRKGLDRQYAVITFPKTLPAYIKMLVDPEGLLWVQDYPRPKSPSRWTVFAPDGRQRAEVVMPAPLEIFEIGRDYVLGKYIDPDEQIPEIRLYSLRRGR